MEIMTRSGLLDTKTLPDVYSPFFCAKCGCRIGWIYEEMMDSMIGLCDECAAVISQDKDKDPMNPKNL